jgi:hypothetical protein
MDESTTDDKFITSFLEQFGHADERNTNLGISKSNWIPYLRYETSFSDTHVVIEFKYNKNDFVVKQSVMNNNLHKLFRYDKKYERASYKHEYDSYYKNTFTQHVSLSSKIKTRNDEFILSNNTLKNVYFSYFNRTNFLNYLTSSLRIIEIKPQTKVIKYNFNNLPNKLKILDLIFPMYCKRTKLSKNIILVV